VKSFLQKRVNIQLFTRFLVVFSILEIIQTFLTNFFLTFVAKIR